MTSSTLTPLSDPDRRARAAHAQKRTLTILVISQIVGTIGVGIAPSIGVLLASQVLENEAWAGLARTASTLGAALLGLPLGNLAARRGRRVALTSGWWMAALGAGILVFAAQWNLVVPLFVGLLLIGAGSAVSLQSRFAATDLAEPKHRARSLSLVVWVGTLGSVLGPNLGAPGAVIGEATGLTVFAAAFLIAAACLAIAGLVIFLMLRPDPLLLFNELCAERDARAAGAGTAAEAVAPSAANPTAPTQRAPRRGNRFAPIFAEIRVNRPARIAVIAILTAQIVMVAIMTMTPVHMTHQGDSVDLVGITISLHVLGMYAFAPLVGWITDRTGHRAAIWAGIAILVVSLVIGALWPADTLWLIVSLFLLGVGWSFVNVAGSALFAETVSDEVRASSQGGVDALANLCGATAAFAAGPLLVISSFSFLSVLGIAALVPLGIVVLRRFRIA